MMNQHPYCILLMVIVLLGGLQMQLAKAQSAKNSAVPMQRLQKAAKIITIARNTTQNVSSSLRSLNPICPPGVYIADPEVRQMPNGRVYLYGYKDEPGNAYCSREYDVLSTTDMVLWLVDQGSFSTKGTGDQVCYTDEILYAPDCIERDGKYYLYYCLAGGGKDEGVAVAGSPCGPFMNGQVMEGISGIDPSVFIDDDGQGYLFWGQAYAKGAKLSQDLKSIAGPVHDSLLTYEKDAFNEGSSIRKRNGIYYYVYASHIRHGKSNCATLCYATAAQPLGPYTYRGVLIDNYGSGRNLVNNHGCIQEVNGQWYVFYHRPTHGSQTMRKACVEPVSFNEDGTINEVEMTTQGVGGLIDPLQRMEGARACLMQGHLMVSLRRPANDIPVEYLGGIRNGDYAYWKYFDFMGKSAGQFTCKLWGQNQAANIEIRLDKPDGQLLGTLDIGASEASTAYTIHQTPVKNITGKHAVVLVFKAKEGADQQKDLLNLEWFAFGKSKGLNGQFARSPNE